MVGSTGKVYAFEPNLNAYASTCGLMSNYISIPMAVSEVDGPVEFQLNQFDDCSSLLPPNDAGVELYSREGIFPTSNLTFRRRKSTNEFKVIKKLFVPSIRLDTFMEVFHIGTVDFLKVDAQGADLAVVRSAGNRLEDIQRITLETSSSEVSLYEGGTTASNAVDYLNSRGFRLVSSTFVHSFEKDLTFARF